MLNLAAAQTKTFMPRKLRFRFLGVKMLFEKNACCFSSEMLPCWKKILRQFKLNLNLPGCKKIWPYLESWIENYSSENDFQPVPENERYFLLGVAAPEKPNKIILCLKLFWCFGLEIHSELLFQCYLCGPYKLSDRSSKSPVEFWPRPSEQYWALHTRQPKK